MIPPAALAVIRAALEDNDLADRVAAGLTREGWRILPIPARNPGLSTHAQVFAARTRDAGNGHLDWIGAHTAEGAPRFNDHGTVITANQLAWKVGRKRPPVGRVQRDCDHPGCVAPDHLTDHRDRELIRAILRPTTTEST